MIVCWKRKHQRYKLAINISGSVQERESQQGKGEMLEIQIGRSMTVFILEQVPAGSVLEVSKYWVLEALFRRWFHNFPTPFRDRTGTLSVTASDSSCTLLRLRSIESIGKSSYFTFLTSNLWLLLFSDFITYILQGTLPHIADDIRQVYLCPYTYTCLFSHRHLSCFHHLGQQLRWVFSYFLLYS